MAWKAWNLLDGEINWAALPFIAELLGCDDLDGLVAGLRVIRTYQRGKTDDASSRPDD